MLNQWSSVSCWRQSISSSAKRAPPHDTPRTVWNTSLGIVCRVTAARGPGLQSGLRAAPLLAPIDTLRGAVSRYGGGGGRSVVIDPASGRASPGAIRAVTAMRSRIDFDRGRDPVGVQASAFAA